MVELTKILLIARNNFRSVDFGDIRNKAIIQNLTVVEDHPANCTLINLSMYLSTSTKFL